MSSERSLEAKEAWRLKRLRQSEESPETLLARLPSGDFFASSGRSRLVQGDREKCLAAGANDYLPKPVDTDRLLALPVALSPNL